jgi:hypothetical protein
MPSPKGVIRKKKKSAARQYKAGAKLEKAGKAQKSRAGTRASKEVSKLRKSGELKSGPRKSTRYKAGDAAHKIESGREMQKQAYEGKKVSPKVGMKRSAPGATIGKKGKRVTRRGKVK